ncbi:hypothetical protein [uncultured Bartonella sp.]|uniref:hypothetical protein n=1 Tax=uncultured Bartonella sp. TaxID=104108 RepID=UPI0025E3A682|nr:hypothetical protein [uncultured Bartonella sp.]
MKYILLLFIFFTASFPELASANTPCSGRKGGISHCVGRTFICNDGSTSASTKDCSAYIGGGATNRQSLESSPSLMEPSTGNCSCRSGTYCVGPRGGHYCYSDSGQKSYLPH